MQWLGHLVERLQGTFGDRILYIGHTGSYAKGEAKKTRNRKAKFEREIFVGFQFVL